MTDAITRYLAAVESGDGEQAAVVALGEVAAGTPPEQVMTEIVARAQAEVGERWEAGKWSIAREHMATAIAEDVVAALGAVPADPPAARKGRVVVACVEGEWHSLPSRIAGHVLNRGGWAVTYLGPSVPADQLAAFLHDHGPHAVAVSCVVAANLPGARAVIETARDAGTPVVAGGRGFGSSPHWALAVGANQWAPTAMEARGALESLPSFTDPAPPIRHERMPEHRALARSVTAIVAAVGAKWDGFEVSRAGDFVSWAARSLTAALLVDDRRVFDDYDAWMARAYRPHPGEPAMSVVLRALAAALPDDSPTAHAWVQDAVARAGG